jgi:hypothetical protein
MSVEEEARKANLKFWRLDDDLSGSDEEAEEARADEVGEEAKEAAADKVDSESEYDFEAEDGDNAESSNGDEEDGTSIHGGDHMDVGGSDDAAKKKKEMQDRTPPVLGTKLEEFTYLKPSGPTHGACEACRWVRHTAWVHCAGEHEHQPEEHKS